MENEAEVTVVVEDHTAEVISAVETHAETEIALAEIHAEKEVAVAELQAEAVVAVAEAHTQNDNGRFDALFAELAIVREQNATLAATIAEMQAVQAAVITTVIEETLEDEPITLEGDGEIPADVPAAEALEPPPLGEDTPQEKTRKRHFVSL